MKTSPVLLLKESSIDTEKPKSDQEKFCSECGTVINIKAVVCVKCGVKQLTDESVKEQKSSLTTATILAALGLIGFMGIGHMYVGRVSTGIGMLIGAWILWSLGFIYPPFWLIGIALEIWTIYHVRSIVKKREY